MLWPPGQEEEGSPREKARRKRVFGLYTAVLQAAEEAAVTRARLTSRPHPPTRTAQLRGLLARQSARRDATYQALSKLLEARLAAEPPRSSGVAGRASSLCS